jgi:hypothetical protein
MRLTAPVAERVVEITDLLWEVDVDGTRRPVKRSNAVVALRDRGLQRASRLVAAMPATDDVLDPQAVDALRIRVHYELQRLTEELQVSTRDLLVGLVGSAAAAAVLSVEPLAGRRWYARKGLPERA